MLCVNCSSFRDVDTCGGCGGVLQVFGLIVDFNCSKKTGKWYFMSASDACMFLIILVLAGVSYGLVLFVDPQPFSTVVSEDFDSLAAERPGSMHIKIMYF